MKYTAFKCDLCQANVKDPLMVDIFLDRVHDGVESVSQYDRIDLCPNCLLGAFVRVQKKVVDMGIDGKTLSAVVRGK